MNKEYGIRKGFGEYVQTGGTVGVVMDTTKGELSFVVSRVNLGVAYEEIPLDKPLVPCVVLWYNEDSVELIPSRMEEISVSNNVPVPTNLRIANKTWDSLTVAWNPFARATSYNIEIDGTIYHADSKSKSFTKDKLLQESDHRIRVRSVYKNGISKWSAYINGQTLEMPPFNECIWKSCPSYVDKEIKYAVDKGNNRIVIKDVNNYDESLCTIIGSTAIPLNTVSSWSIKLLKSIYDDGNCIYVGVAPFDIDQNNRDNKGECGWYFGCYTLKLYSGPPHNYKGKSYGPRNIWEGAYFETGDSVGVVINTKKGMLSFSVNGVDFGTAYEGIPLDKPLVPCVLLGYKDTYIELNLSIATEKVNNTIPVPQCISLESVDWDSIKFSWKIVEGASFYQIREGSSTYLEGIRSSTYVKRGLIPSTNYNFAIRTVKDSEVSNWSHVLTGRTQDIFSAFTEGWKMCPTEVDDDRKYTVDANNPLVATKLNDSDDYCTIIGKSTLLMNNVILWNVKITNSFNNDGRGILIGVAPHDINQDKPDNSIRCGWYYSCYSSTIWSGPPQKFDGASYYTRNKHGEYIHNGDVVTTVLNTKTGACSFIINKVNLGLAFKKIPLDKPLVPCVLLKGGGDSVELLG